MERKKGHVLRVFVGGELDGIEESIPTGKLRHFYRCGGDYIGARNPCEGLPPDERDGSGNMIRILTPKAKGWESFVIYTYQRELRGPMHTMRGRKGVKNADGFYEYVLVERMLMTRCQGKNASGKRCMKRSALNEDFCSFHRKAD